jgi:peroxiredoxin
MEQRVTAAAWLLALAFTAAMAADDQTLNAVAPPRAAPDFALADVDGNLHHLDEYLGKPLIVNFWATWCPPCIEEMPSMNRAWHLVKGEGIAMLAINVGEDEDTVFTFTADYPVDFPLLLDENGTAVHEWGVLGLPTTFVVDPRGRIVYQAVGGRAWDDPVLLDQVRALKGD